MFLKKRKLGLYDSKYEKDSCGIGLVANIYDIPSRSIIDNSLKLLSNLTHRGAVSADPKAGDGVGILTQIPHQFFQKELSITNTILPRPDDYAVGMFFLPRNKEEKEYCFGIITKYFRKFGLEIIVKRNVPTNKTILGKSIIGKEQVLEH